MSNYLKEQDSVLVKRLEDSTYEMTRTLTAVFDKDGLEKRYLETKQSLETYKDVLDDLRKNKAKKVKEFSQKLDKEIKELKEAISMLSKNAQALKDALEKGEGSASIIKKGGGKDE